MLKSIQIKTIMIFAILGIIVITSLGLFSIYRLEYIGKILQDEVNLNQDMMTMIDGQIEDTKTMIYYALGIFSMVSIIVGIIVSKIITSPISKLIESAELITNTKPSNDVGLLKKR